MCLADFGDAGTADADTLECWRYWRMAGEVDLAAMDAAALAELVKRGREALVERKRADRRRAVQLPMLDAEIAWAEAHLAHVRELRARVEGGERLRLTHEKLYARRQPVSEESRQRRAESARRMTRARAARQEA